MLLGLPRPLPRIREGLALGHLANVEGSSVTRTPRISGSASSRSTPMVDLTTLPATSSPRSLTLALPPVPRDPAAVLAWSRLPAGRSAPCAYVNKPQVRAALRDGLRARLAGAEHAAECAPALDALGTLHSGRWISHALRTSGDLTPVTVFACQEGPALTPSWGRQHSFSRRAESLP